MTMSGIDEIGVDSIGNNYNAVLYAEFPPMVVSSSSVHTRPTGLCGLLDQHGVAFPCRGGR